VNQHELYDSLMVVNMLKGWKDVSSNPC